MTASSRRRPQSMPVGRIAAMLFVQRPRYVSKVLIRRNPHRRNLRLPATVLSTSRPSWATITRRSGSGWKAEPDATLAELRDWLLETHQVSVSVTLMWEALAQLGLTLKKDLARRGTGAAPDVARARSEWRENQPTLNPRRLIFIDETWAKTNMVPPAQSCQTRPSADRHPRHTATGRPRRSLPP